MQIQVRTDNHIENSEQLFESVRADVESALHGQFGEQLRRVEVYLHDTNGHKGGVDKHCSVEARLAGLQPVAVHHTGSSVEEVVNGAVDKLVRALQSKLGRLEDRGGHVPMSGDQA